MGKVIGIVLILLIVVGVAWAVPTYNGLVKLDEGVQQSWSQVENVYQRRMDLIPNLVETVKGAAEFEKETFTAVAQARANAGNVTLTPEMLNDPLMLQKFDQAQGALGSALSRLLVTIERYPDLKANANFVALQDELAGTENRISVERKRFTETVQGYNSKVRRFPTNLLAGILGFPAKPYFQGREGADQPPKVEF